MPTYRKHIEEAFITPIRSVLAIDDLFPTLDAFVSGKLDKSDAEKEDAKRLRVFLDFCRDPKRQWTVDVHDGRGFSPGQSTTEALRKCDLLILDYHLDGEGQGMTNPWGSSRQ